MFARLFTFGFGFATAMAAWRNVPRTTAPKLEALGLLIIVGLVIAYRAGRDWQRARWNTALATAIADARADAFAESRATAAAAVNVHLPHQHTTEDMLPPTTHVAAYTDEELADLVQDEGDGSLDPEAARELLAEVIPLEQPPSSEPTLSGAPEGRRKPQGGASAPTEDCDRPHPQPAAQQPARAPRPNRTGRDPLADRYAAPAAPPPRQP